MNADWCRLWHDMPTDPKWRVIARKSGRPLSEVVSVFVLMLTTASQADERGALQGWDDEDAGAALDIDAEAVTAIREAMQGRVLDGAALSGWERRQPKRERPQDVSTERVKAFRERERRETPCNATERTETPRGEERREEKEEANASSKKKGCRLPDDWQPSQEDASAVGAPASLVATELPKFRDYWRGRPGQQGVKLDWDATWRNWLREAIARKPRGGTGPPAYRESRI